MLYDYHGNKMRSDFDYDIGVMSFNVEAFYGTNSNLDVMKEVITKNGADIIGLQEYAQTIGGESVATTLLKDYPNVIYGDGSTSKKGLASKFALSDYSDVVYANQYQETRTYTKCYFNYLDKQIAWFNTHLELPQQAVVQVGQANELFAATQLEEYFIVTGDFNCIYATSTETQHYRQFIKPYLDAGCHSANCCYEHGWFNTCTENTTLDGASPWYPIDQVFTSPNIDIVAVNTDLWKAQESDGTYIIDHIPIMAYLKVN